jgi:DNA-binding SARP family transcriptional activator
MRCLSGAKHLGVVTVQVRLLGPVDVTVNGSPRSVSGARRKAVLAVLALQADEVVSTDRLIGVVWGGAAPSAAHNTLQSHVSHLRQVLENKAAIVARPPGYVLNLGPDATDVAAVEHLVRSTNQIGGAAERARQLRAALAQWRGRPLVDVLGHHPWLDEQAERLDRLWTRINIALADARLALGEHSELIPDLEALSREHPFDEQIHHRLMTALYGAGRQADALATFQRLRRTLAEELGVDPTQELRDLESAILRQDPDLSPPPVAGPLGGVADSWSRPVTPAAGVPTQLPPARNGFAGRVPELASLDALAARRSAAVVVCAVVGTAGVGKTALALHWAHRSAPDFPDGQLYVDLRGFDPHRAPLDPADVVRGFLDALEVPVDQIPAGLDAQTGLYRSLLAARQMLVVLDNARDIEQVRPLLPGAPGSLAIVTSRDQLVSLVAAVGARPLVLDLFRAAEARDLLTRRLGEARVAAEPGAVEQIIARCAGLPLALAIAAARAATRPGFPLALLAEELREAGGTLDALDGGDPFTDVRAVLSWSYRRLSPDAARLFRLLGPNPGRDMSAAAAASLAGVRPGEVRPLLAELTRAHLLTEASPRRYAFHDLLRAYAIEQAHRSESDDDRRAAVGRLLDHYVHTGHSVPELLEPVGSR